MSQFNETTRKSLILIDSKTKQPVKIGERLIDKKSGSEYFLEGFKEPYSTSNFYDGKLIQNGARLFVKDVKRKLDETRFPSCFGVEFVISGE